MERDCNTLQVYDRTNDIFSNEHVKTIQPLDKTPHTLHLGGSWVPGYC